MGYRLKLQERLAQAFLVEPRESRIVAYTLGLFLLLGFGLALGRGTADALFFKRYGIEYLPVIYVLSAMSLAVSCTLYASFADRLSSERFFKYILGILGVSLVFVWAMMRLPENDWTYPLYYVLYEVASELILIHAGLYLNQNLDALQAKRLVPLIFGGSQVGIILGGIMLAVLSPMLGVGNIMLIWALASGACIVMVVYWHRKQGVSPFYKAGRKRKLAVRDSLESAFQGVRYMKHSELLRMASFALFFMVIMFYILIYSVNQIYTETFKTEEALSSFFGLLVAVNSAIALFVQFFIANRLLRRFGVKSVNLFFPVTSLFSYFMLMVSFTFPSALVGSFNKDVVMTAFRNPVWNLMLNALPGNIQGRARAMTVAVVIPLALLSAGILLITVQSLESPFFVAVMGFVSAVLYLYFSRHMNRVYVKEIISHLKQKLALPDGESGVAIRGGNNAILQELVRGIEQSDDQIYLAYAKSMIESYPELAPDIILKRLPEADSKTQDQIVRLLLPLGSNGLANSFRRLMNSADDRLKATCYYALIVLRDEAVVNEIPVLLVNAHARFRAVGVLGVYFLGLEEMRGVANRVWNELIMSDDPLLNMFGLELVGMTERLNVSPELSVFDLKHAIGNLLQEDDVRGCLLSLKISHHLPRADEAWLKKLIRRLSDHHSQEVRTACLHGCLTDEGEDLWDIVEKALEDAHPGVREEAARLLNQRLKHGLSDTENPLASTLDGSPRAQSAVLKYRLAENVSHKRILQFARLKVEETECLNETLILLKQEMKHSDASALNMLSIVLKERLDATIDLVLQALQRVEDADSVNAIRLGMKSQDAQLRAAACEALYGLEDKDIGRSLAALIEFPGCSNKNIFPAVGQAIKWCLNRNDPWLYRCAQATQSVLAF